MKRTLAQKAQNYFQYSAIMSNAHYDMAEIYRARHRKFGVVVVVVTTIVGATALGSLTKLAGPSQEDWIKFVASCNQNRAEKQSAAFSTRNNCNYPYGQTDKLQLNLQSSTPSCNPFRQTRNNCD